MKNKKMLKRIITLAAVVCVVFSMAVPAFATSETNYADVAVSAMQEGLAEVTGTISINNVLTVLLSVLGIAVGFMFFWWGLRKVISVARKAFQGRFGNV